MGTSIKVLVEVRCADGWALVDRPVFPYPAQGESRRSPFSWKGYGMFGLFAGVRNDSQSAVLSEPRGVPGDISEAAAYTIIGATPFEDYPILSLVEKIEQACGSREEYGLSWLTAAELQSFDYDDTFLDMREAPPRRKSYREFLGETYFTHLQMLGVLGHPEGVRIIFWFCD